MAKHRAIPPEFMTVGGMAKKWALPSARCNTMIKWGCSLRQQKAKAGAGFIQIKIGRRYTPENRTAHSFFDGNRAVKS